MSQLSTELTTQRLRLLPIHYPLALRLRDDEEGVPHWLGCTAAPGWIDEEFRGVLPGVTEDLSGHPDVAPWNRLVIERSSNTLIGTAGFIGLPHPDGSVEVGYGIASDYRNRGYATEAVGRLIDWVFSDHPQVVGVFATCDQENTASIRVLEKLGLGCCGIVDPMMFWQVTRHQWQQRTSKQHSGGQLSDS